MQISQSASEGSRCASGPRQSWGEPLRWRSRNNGSFAALYRKPKRREGRQLPETAGFLELAVPPLKTQLGLHLLVVGVGSRGAGWDAVPLCPSPAPCEWCRERELTREFSSLRSQDFEWAKTAGEGKGTVPACLQKSGSPPKTSCCWPGLGHR